MLKAVLNVTIFYLFIWLGWKLAYVIAYATPLPV